MARERLDKITAINLGISRKNAHRLIKAGSVAVNGSVVKDVGFPVEQQTDSITLDGKEVCVRRHVYIMLNKPAGIISESRNPREETVVDLVPEGLKRKGLFPCGRLDRDTTGLLVITDDGDFAHRLISPSHHVYKTYIARLDAPLDDKDAEKLRAGITLGDGTKCLPAIVETFVSEGEPCAEIRIREGKYHQVKRMCAACGSQVVALHRRTIGRVTLDEDLAPGECRELTQEEMRLIFEDA